MILGIFWRIDQPILHSINFNNIFKWTIKGQYCRSSLKLGIIWRGIRRKGKIASFDLNILSYSQAIEEGRPWAHRESQVVHPFFPFLYAGWLLGGRWRWLFFLFDGWDLAVGCLWIAVKVEEFLYFQLYPSALVDRHHFRNGRYWFVQGHCLWICLRFYFSFDLDDILAKEDIVLSLRFKHFIQLSPCF